MAVLNMYHVYPLREIPDWLQTMQQCTSCTPVRPHKLQTNDAPVITGNTERTDNHALTTEDQPIDSTDTGGDDVKTQTSFLDGGIVSGIDVIIKKITANEEEENFRLRWKKLARCFDRLLFCVFATLHLFMVLFIFVQK